MIILGPTGVGKSAAGVFLAGRHHGEIINCDSMQVYRGFDIGTDKPTAEMRGKVPHHLLDAADPASQFSAGDFVREAMAAIRLIEGRGRLPFIVGGTGLYLKALLEGLFPGPGRDIALRRRLEEEAREHGLESLRRRLEQVDPAYSRLIGARDRVRIFRALEVYILTGKPISEHFAATKSETTDFQPLKIGLQLRREELYRRIEERVERMFQDGIVEETASLLASGVGEDVPPFRALGYKHVLCFLKKQISLREAVERTKTDTRHYAKRQIIWFRKMKGVEWFPAGDHAGLAALVESRLAS
ncbi:MAG: tRNA (adenosine(37)-N6)-dimethylallyltransferase MiaA [Acidobacteriota bacterium]